jgi:hypothetical protein
VLDGLHWATRRRAAVALPRSFAATPTTPLGPNIPGGLERPDASL